jgi:hypothetical protein
MSTRTSAISDDFPHFIAWYGGVPDFQYLAHLDEFHCRDQWFMLRQLVDMRYYAQFQYTESENYNSSLIMRRISDLNTCRKIQKLPPAERPSAYQRWFLTRQIHPPNDVWEYRDPPRIRQRVDS